MGAAQSRAQYAGRQDAIQKEQDVARAEERVTVERPAAHLAACPRVKATLVALQEAIALQDRPAVNQQMVAVSMAPSAAMEHAAQPAQNAPRNMACVDIVQRVRRDRLQEPVELPEDPPGLPNPRSHQILSHWSQRNPLQNPLNSRLVNPRSHQRHQIRSLRVSKQAPVPQQTPSETYPSSNSYILTLNTSRSVTSSRACVSACKHEECKGIKTS